MRAEVNVFWCKSVFFSLKKGANGGEEFFYWRTHFFTQNIRCKNGGVWRTHFFGL